MAYPRRTNSSIDSYEECSTVPGKYLKEICSDSDIEEFRDELDYTCSIIEKTIIEKTICFSFQILPSVLLAGVGMVFAGLKLNSMQHVPALAQHKEIFVMIPPLIGLKGNLEMTMASRLSTQANVGTFKDKSSARSMCIGNILLSILQAIVVGALAAAIVVLGYGDHAKIAFLLCTSVATTAVTSAVLGMLMVSLIFASTKIGIDPDNIATPIAAALGDFTTLLILSNVTVFVTSTNRLDVLFVLMLLLCGLFTAYSCRYCHGNPYTSDVLFTGWPPIIGAMCISSIGGHVLHSLLAVSPQMALFQPVINGVGGNLAAIQASRLSTELHRTVQSHENSIIEETHSRLPLRVSNSVLLLLTPLCHVVLIWVSKSLYHLDIDYPPVFYAFYLGACMIQVGVLLSFVSLCVPLLGRYGLDPDNYAIPFATSLGDVLGTGLLYLLIIFGINA